MGLATFSAFASMLNFQVDANVICEQGFLHLMLTRMNSSMMRTARFSCHLGGVCVPGGVGVSA